jgi:hypothetical protein
MRYTRSFLGLLMFLAISAEGLAGLWTTNEFIYKPSPGARGEREKSTYDSGLDRVDVRLAKEVWVGDPKFGATLQDAITGLGANTAVLRVPKGTHNLDANLTIPDNITLKPEPGAILAIATTKTLTINGKFEAGLVQVFSCTGTGKVVFAAGSNQTIVPQWWGASPLLGASVNTPAIQASLNAITSFTSWTLPPGDYICNAPLVIGDYATTVFGLHLDFKGRLRFDGCSGLDVRNIFNSTLKGIYVKRITQDWSDDTTTTDFGFKIGAGRHCKIEILHSEDFSYGIWLDGDTRSNAYLDFSLGYITENKHGMYITWLNGGWNNENNYHGGTFTSNRAVLTPYTKVNTTDNTITLDAGWPSTYVTGYAVYFTLGESDNTTAPAPLTIGTKYYVIRDSSTVIKLAASYADAMAGTAIDLTSQGNSTLRFGKAGSWGVRFYGSGSSFDNHRWYGTAFESLHNGMYLAGYAGGRQMFLYAPRFEAVANWIEAAPRQLTWEVGACSLERTSMQKYCPRMIGSDEKSTVTIKGIGYYDLDAYQPYATPKDALGDTSYAKGGAFTFYNPLALEQTTNWKNQVKDYFTLQVNELVADTGGTSSRHTKYFPMNKGFEGSAGPTAGIEYPMTYAKNAVVWNTNVASGQPMGWVCSKSGSVVRASSITGTGNVTGTTLTVTAGTSTKYLFAGAFLLIDGVQHQIKKVVSYDAATSLGVYELYANNLGGNVTGKAIANDPPTWVAMANFDAAAAGGAWGSITGTLTDQTDLIALLGGANIPSPTEFGYVKGVTSSIQTQIGALGAGGVPWLNVVVNTTNTLDAILAAAPPAGTTILVPNTASAEARTLHASNNRTVPAGVALKVEIGSPIIVPTGRTFTINGHLDAGPYTVFSCVGTGLVKFANTSNQTALFPAWWGAVGDGVTNDTDAWQRCFNTAMAYTSSTYGYYTIEATSKAKYLVEEIIVSSASDPFFIHVKGNNATFVQATTNNVLTITAINSMVRISDFYFSGATGNSGYGISFGDANTGANIKIYNCRFNKFNSGIYGRYSIGVAVEDCEFFSGNNGIKEFTTNNSHVSNVWSINRCLFNANVAAAIDIDSSVSGGNAGNYDIRNSIFEVPGAEAIKMNGVYRFSIDNCYIEGGANVNADNPIMRLTSCSNGEIKRVGFGWSTANLTATDAVYMTDCYNILFDQCNHNWGGAGSTFKGFYKTTNTGSTLSTTCHGIEIKRLNSSDSKWAILTSGAQPIARVTEGKIWPFVIQPPEFITYSPGQGELQEACSPTSMMGLFDVGSITATNATLTKDDVVTYNGHPTYRVEWTGATPSIIFNNFFAASTATSHWSVGQFFYKSDTDQVVDIVFGTTTDPGKSYNVPISGDGAWRSFASPRYSANTATTHRLMGITTSSVSSGKIWIAIPSYRHFSTYNGAAAGMCIRSYY